MTNHSTRQEPGEWVECFAKLARDIRHIWTNLTTPPSAQSSAAPTGATPTPTQPHVQVRHESCQVHMSVNTDALAAEWSRRDDRHEEDIPCRFRDGPAAGAGAQQNGPNFTFGDEIRQEERPLQHTQVQYLTSSTTITVSHNSTRPLGVNLGMNGIGTGLGLGQGGAMLGAGHRPSLLAIDGDVLAILAVIIFVFIGAWFLRH
ncbi:hypothetical protein F4801DRAFT_574195 [Xylaria longipes]|nr:hypothetical protein F4801DRAFT_574195 [Xylaria longipes]RYC63045.1 hypothetical protein CHU98_g3158 [Xylaria longipes]